jgi:beta-glucosidase
MLRKIGSEALVLMKNEENTLQFRKEKKTAVIGPSVRIATYCGGGSAVLNPYETVTPLDGISSAAQGGVEFAQGFCGH